MDTHFTTATCRVIRDEAGRLLGFVELPAGAFPFGPHAPTLLLHREPGAFGAHTLRRTAA